MGTKQLIGELGEDFVAKYLLSRNYEILDRNWRIREGEIDLVAISEHGVIVFVEVKTRTNSAFGHPLEAITRDKAYRLQRLALAWLIVHHRWGFEYRIDAAGVLISKGEKFEIDYRIAVL
ncbi:MAG: YraN family protein [Actinobacteria bacterium]|nr:YraN family protein [Actinomycetota bacterium]MDA2981257.1 YraN family protein [Actinomycetota bacterium]MDA2996179.1 YraN family protein [Actinomycetota bacterium]